MARFGGGFRTIVRTQPWGLEAEQGEAKEGLEEGR